MCKECGCGMTTALTCPACGGNVVLIDGEAVCLVCGTSPDLAGDPSHQAHSHEHPHEHPHDHAHVHAHELTEHAHAPTAVHAPSEDEIKLLRLLPYWIEHNEEHAGSFRRWAEVARGLGQTEVAERMEAAVARMEACNEELRAALDLLQ
ncbi:MAG: hypothetical protein H5T62_03480 [Anaerolineae bacterium]|nr:hypothetical protein [Anaerolineae bacterium]